VSFRQSPLGLNLKRLILIGGLMLIVLTGCANNQIDVTNPIAFRHRSGVFELQVPKSWKQVQDQVETEALAAFSDATGRSEIIAYAGLLDHHLTDEEGLTILPNLVTNLLNGPQDLKITDKQRRSDGAFVVTMAFTRNNVKRLGQAILRDGGLALSGVIVSGPESDWKTLLTGLQPYIDSFKLNPDYVQGTFFTPIENTHFALVVPSGWGRQPIDGGNRVRSTGGQLIIDATQLALTAPLTAETFNEAVTRRLQQQGGSATLTDSQTLPDGRVKLIYTRAAQQITGYAEQKDGMLITLFFTVPTNQADAYQPFIDFMYSTFITGKA
jgi:hypothetical protein